MPNPIRLTLALSNPTPTPSGEYEILAITSGLGNGWHFPPAVLQSSLPLWDGVHCFLDHALTQRSVRDIAGILINPSFDEDSQGIRAKLQPFGPGADLLASLASVLIPPQKDYHIGFSADLSFLGTNQTVKEIVKVHSVDLVVNPARGGKFIESRQPQVALDHAEDMGLQRTQPVVGSAHPAHAGNKNFRPKEIKSTNKGDFMSDTPQIPESKRAQHALDHALREGEVRHNIQLSEPDQEPKLLDNQNPDPSAYTSHFQQELDQFKELRRQLSAITLDQTLAASNLPKPSTDHLRKQFSGTDFTLPELQSAIAEQRQLLSDLTASSAIIAHGQPTQMFNETDRIQAAVDDLFNLPRDPAQASIKVPRLTGIRELYLSLTGDTDLHGGYFPERVQLATTADFTGLVKNALNKIISNTWEELGRAGYDWWKYVTTQEHFATLHPITGTLVGTVGSLPTVAEGGAYTELPVGDSPETASFTKYGGYIPLTLELIDRDETRKLRAYTRELASAGMRNISSLVSAIFTANSGIGPTMADTGALFNATAVTTAGGHANLSTTALSATSWDTVCGNVYKQPMLIKNAATYYGTGPQMAVNPKFLLVPRAMQKLAREICEGSFVRESGYVYDNVLKGSAVPITVPEWTDANNWAAACDPLIAPAIFIGERFGLMPEIFVAGSELSPAVFTNDEHRLKVRHFLAVWVNDFRPLAKANVA